MYWDANNLYGWAMIQNLCYGVIKFLSENEINSFDFNSITENSPIGYILEVDLEYCKQLHNSHNDYPLRPEKIKVSNDMFCKYCKDIADWHDKLISNLSDFITEILGIICHWE